jgi:uncharacterized protein (TIGR02145 family)
MQNWTGCSSLTTTTVSGTTYGACLKDSRDGKIYEVRKFADGKCWMVDNLRYGGSSDACAGRTSFSGNGSATATNRFGTNTYGDCRDPAAGGSAPCANSNDCGYYYNWQAAMQHASAYYNSTYTGNSPNTNNDICPTGWHVPTGGSSGEFVALYNANGTTYSTDSCPAGTAYCDFWRPGGNFKGWYSGVCNNSGSLSDQGSFSGWWSSTPVLATNAYNLLVTSSYVLPANYTNRYYGFAVRCRRD